MAEDTYDFDLLVIGAGSGGVRCARMAATHGARVGIIEERYLGGTCVNVGCVPKKLFSYAAHFSEDFEDAAGFGWRAGERQFDWPTLRDNKDREIDRLNGIYGRILEQSGAELINGHGRFVDKHKVAVGDTVYSAAHILIAVGGWPFVPDIPGAEHAISSNEIFHLEQLPEHMTVVGGGYIATEFAGILNGLGVAVTQVYRGELFLRGFDREIREELASSMREKGVDVRFECDVKAIEKTDTGLRLQLVDGSSLDTGAVMYATGRKPLLENLGLDNTGVALDERGYISVDAQFSTSVEHIHALGDVIGRIELTPVALAEGTLLAARLFNNGDKAMDYRFVPSAVFSQPSIGTVGITEDDALEHYQAVDVYTSRFTHLKHTLSGNAEKTLMKLIVDRATDKVVGAHMLGADAAEILQGLAIAIKAGATKADFDATIGIHPSAAEEFVTMRSVSRQLQRSD